MTTEPQSKPVPRPDELTQPFWDAAKEHRLVIQRCKECGYYNHPPRPLCDKCSAADLVFEEVSGKGKISSFTLMHQKNVPGFAGEVPYLNVLVELQEQPLLYMITNLRGTEDDSVKLDQAVEVIFEKVSDDITLPQFKILK